MCRIRPGVAEMEVQQNGDTKVMPFGRFFNDLQPRTAKAWTGIVPHSKSNQIHALLDIHARGASIAAPDGS